MTVEELLAELQQMPPTAIVVARIRHNVVLPMPFSVNLNLEDLYEYRDAPIESAVYDLGEVYLQLDENGVLNI